MSDATPPVEPLNPAECALIVADFQPVVLGPMTDAAQLLECTNAAIATARKHGIRVAFVRVALDQEDYASVPATNRAFSAVAKAGYLPANGPTTALDPRLDVQDHDLIVRKVRVGALSTTKLDESLTNLGVTTLVIAGVHTSGVILSTVRDAADRDYRMLLLTDCISDPDQELHETLMTKILARQADLIASDQFAELIVAN